MRRMTMLLSGAVLMLCIGLAGCASDRGMHCGGDLVPINPPSVVAHGLKHSDPPQRVAGGSP